MRQLGLPQALTVRFVRVRLSTGEWEVMVTSLRDEVAYPTVGFLELYHWRWSVETFYGVLKQDPLGLGKFIGPRGRSRPAGLSGDRVLDRLGIDFDRDGTSPIRCERNPSSPDGQPGGLLQCHQTPRPGPVVEQPRHPTLDRAVDRVVSDPSDLRTSATLSAPSENFRQSLAGFPSSTEKALLLKEIRLT